MTTSVLSVVRADGSRQVLPAYGSAFKYTLQGWLAVDLLTGKDFLSIQGSATNVVRIKRIKAILLGDGTNVGGFALELVRETTVPTSGGTTATLTGNPYDPLNVGTATAVVKSLTHTVTNGLNGVVLCVDALNVSGTTVLGTSLKDTITWDFSQRLDEAPTLRGIADFFALRCVGGAPTTSTFDLEIELEESPV